MNTAPQPARCDEPVLCPDDVIRPCCQPAGHSGWHDGSPVGNLTDPECEHCEGSGSVDYCRRPLVHGLTGYQSCDCSEVECPECDGTGKAVIK